jgi:hypothetical protein
MVKKQALIVALVKTILVLQKVVAVAGDVLDAKAMGEWVTSSNNPESLYVTPGF